VLSFEEHTAGRCRTRSRRAEEKAVFAVHSYGGQKLAFLDRVAVFA
jgi:hypothetical protein